MEAFRIGRVNNREADDVDQFDGDHPRRRRIGTPARRNSRGEAAPAGEHDRVIRYALATAAQATEARAFDEAVMLHRRAIDLLDDSPEDDSTRRCDLVLELARAERLAGGDWRGTVAEAIELARSLADGDRTSVVVARSERSSPRAALVLSFYEARSCCAWSCTSTERR